MESNLLSLFQKWNAWLTQVRRYSNHTIEAYLRDFQEFLHFLQTHRDTSITLDLLISLKTTDFRSWMAWRHGRDLTNRSTARAASALRSFYKFVSRETGQEIKVLHLIHSPRVKIGLPRPLGVEDTQQLLDDIGDNASQDWIGLRDTAFFTLLYATGMRISEGLSLRGSDLPLPSQLVIIGKGAKQRIVPILKTVRTALEAYQKACPYPILPEGPVFLGAKGGPLNPSIAQKTLRNYRRSIGLPESVTPHALRHSCATHLLENSGELRAIQELLGHASLATTQGYTKVDQHKLMEAFKKAHPRSE